MNGSLKNEIARCIQDLRQAADLMDRTANELSQSVTGLGDLKMVDKLHRNARLYRKAAQELRKAQ